MSLAVYVLVSWLDGGAVVALALCPCFDVLCMHTSLDDKGKGKVQGGVGCPHSQGLSWPTFWSVLGLTLTLRCVQPVFIPWCEVVQDDGWRW